MSRDSIREVWSNFLEGEPLSEAEDRDLLEALRGDAEFRREILDDARLEGLLYVLGTSSDAPDMLARAVFERIDAEKDATRFVREVESRLDGGRSHTGSVRRGTRRLPRSGGRRHVLPILVAAALMIGVVALWAGWPVGVPEPERAARAEVVPPSVDAPPDAAAAEKALREAEDRLREVQRQREELARAEKEARERKEADVASRAARVRVEKERVEREMREAVEKARSARALAKSPPAPAPTTQTEAPTLRTDRVEGAVFAVRSGTRTALAAGQALGAGDGLETGPGGAVLLIYPDGTRLEIDPGSEARDFRLSEGKSLLLKRGTLRAEVARQPAGHPMAFLTPHGEATVLGTTLRIVVDSEKTRLEVEEGKVRLKRSSDGKTVDVGGGHYAVAAAGVELSAEATPPPTPALARLQAAGELVINFGADGTPLPDGVLNDSGEEYDPKRGYGWKGPKAGSKLLGVTSSGARVTSGRVAWPAPAGRDPLRASGVEAGWFNHTETWTLALPRGRYLVTLSVGDLDTAQGPHHVRVENLQFINALLTGPGEPVEVTAPVELKDGELTVVVGGHGTGKADREKSSGTVLNFIKVRPAREKR